MTVLFLVRVTDETNLVLCCINGSVETQWLCAMWLMEENLPVMVKLPDLN